MEFKACKYLSFDQERFSCELVKVSNHLGWERITIDGELQLCQQCTKRGRLNNPQSCIGEMNAMCGDYEEHTFSFNDGGVR